MACSQPWRLLLAYVLGFFTWCWKDLGFDLIIFVLVCGDVMFMHSSGARYIKDFDGRLSKPSFFNSNNEHHFDFLSSNPHWRTSSAQLACSVELSRQKMVMMKFTYIKAWDHRKILVLDMGKKVNGIFLLY